MGLTRRALLAVPFAVKAASDKGRVLSAEGRRYLDPGTEFPVERLTDPTQASFLPYPYARAIGKRGMFLIFSSDRGDGMQAYRYELRSGDAKQLTEARDLRPSSLNILPDDRTFCYLDGRSLRLAPFGNGKDREVYRIPDDWEAGEGLCVSLDGIYAALIEKQTEKYRLRLIGMTRGNATTIAESTEPIRHPQPRPRRASVLFQQGDSLHLVNYDGQQNKRLCPVKASPGAAHWSPDGRNVAYLSAKDRTVVVREITPDTMQDKLVAPTSQFASFARNVDGSVFVGASASLGSPYVLVLVRSVRRELTLCEHKSGDTDLVAPIFSPTSQRIYFQSDRHGKAAIYSVVVDKFLEKTETDEEKK